VALNNLVNTSGGVKEFNVDMGGGSYHTGASDGAGLHRRRALLVRGLTTGAVKG